MKEVVADRAYSSRENLDFAISMGLIPFIPFKKNVTGKPKGVRIWRVMFDIFQKQREAFMKRYHKRSNVETCFHVLKQRFGSNLTTRTKIANGNELKMKVLCHNLCVLIQEIFESGVEVDFVESVRLYNNKLYK